SEDGLFSCNSDNVEPASFTEQELEAAESEAVMDETFGDVDDIGFYAALEADNSGRLMEDESNPLRCADVSHDKENNVITVDFGEGCYDWKDRLLQGKVIITYTDRIFVPGAVHTMTFDDFYVDSIQVEGVRTRTNLADDTSDTLKFQITLENGKLTWPDVTFATRDADHTVKRIRALNPIEDERHLDGSAEGTTRGGLAYSSEILETIVFKRSCYPRRNFIPVSGVKVIRLEGFSDTTIDYGDGTCDNVFIMERNQRRFEVRVLRRVRNG
ncbi:MAG TPA: hypothetical protein DDY13_00180, partial [Cytophagales bacterium]|nr:hypothetical protein [Cytophagales bacterium]